MNDTKTVSGAIVHVTDADEAPLVRCLVDITPKQSGTGTPSPENVRPISGWESVNVYKSGKNLLAMPYYDGSGTSNGITWTVNDDGTVTANGTATADSAFYLRYNDGFLPYGQYIFNGCPSGGSDNTYFVRVASYGGYGQVNDYGNGATFDHAETNPVIANRLRIILTVKSGTTLNNTVFKPMIRAVGSSAEYAPYTGTTTTTSLGRTVYGGTLDVVSGVLTAYPFYQSYNGETLNCRWLCDRAVYAEGTTPPTGSQVALISGTGTTYTLTGQEVSAMYGENYIWNNSGDTTIEYTYLPYGLYGEIRLDGEFLPKPRDFKPGREDVYAGEYTTCTGKTIADKIGWKFSDLDLQWDALKQSDIDKLINLTNACSLRFDDVDGLHTEDVIRTSAVSLRNRNTIDGVTWWRDVSAQFKFINTHNE